MSPRPLFTPPKPTICSPLGLELCWESPSGEVSYREALQVARHESQHVFTHSHLKLKFFCNDSRWSSFHHEWGKCKGKMWLFISAKSTAVVKMANGYIHIVLFFKTLYNLPLTHPFTHTHTPMGASYSARCWPDHREQFRYSSMWTEGVRE